MNKPFAVGDRVVVKNDPDNDLFQGVTGVVEKVGVKCMAGEGVVMRTHEFGLLRGSYDMLERVQ